MQLQVTSSTNLELLVEDLRAVLLPQEYEVHEADLRVSIEDNPADAFFWQIEDIASQYNAEVT